MTAQLFLLPCDTQNCDEKNQVWCPLLLPNVLRCDASHLSVFHFVDRIEHIECAVIVSDDNYAGSKISGNALKKLHHLTATVAIQCR